MLNTSLFTGPPSEGFLRWRAFATRGDDLPVGPVMRRSLADPRSDEVIAGYEAPFPDASFQAGVLRFPHIVPTSPDDPGADALRRVEAALGAWERPALVLFSTADPDLLGRGGPPLRRRTSRAPGRWRPSTVPATSSRRTAARRSGPASSAFLRRTG